MPTKACWEYVDVLAAGSCVGVHCMPSTVADAPGALAVPPAVFAHDAVPLVYQKRSPLMKSSEARSSELPFTATDVGVAVGEGWTVGAVVGASVGANVGVPLGAEVGADVGCGPPDVPGGVTPPAPPPPPPQAASAATVQNAIKGPAVLCNFMRYVNPRASKTIRTDSNG